MSGFDVAVQHFRGIPDSQIEELIAQGLLLFLGFDISREGDVLTCAGGFVIEDMGDSVGEREGEQSTIMGMPKTLTLKLIEEIRQ